MNFRNTLTGLLLILCVGGVGYLAYWYAGKREPARCDFCGRVVLKEASAAVVLNTGAERDACCPRCALHSLVQKPGEVRSVTVTDMETGSRMPAERGFYVEGAKADCCSASADPRASRPPPREPGVSYDVVFDRCMPGLQAFGSEPAARAFQKRSGGRILTYAQALESVKHH